MAFYLYIIMDYSNIPDLPSENGGMILSMNTIRFFAKSSRVNIVFDYDKGFKKNYFVRIAGIKVDLVGFELIKHVEIIICSNSLDVNYDTTKLGKRTVNVTHLNCTGRGFSNNHKIMSKSSKNENVENIFI